MAASLNLYLFNCTLDWGFISFVTPRNEGSHVALRVVVDSSGVYSIEIPRTLGMTNAVTAQRIRPACHAEARSIPTLVLHIIIQEFPLWIEFSNEVILFLSCPALYLLFSGDSIFCILKPFPIKQMMALIFSRESVYIGLLMFTQSSFKIVGHACIKYCFHLIGDNIHEVVVSAYGFHSRLANSNLGQIVVINK